MHFTFFFRTHPLAISVILALLFSAAICARNPTNQTERGRGRRNPQPNPAPSSSSSAVPEGQQPQPPPSTAAAAFPPIGSTSPAEAAVVSAQNAPRSLLPTSAALRQRQHLQHVDQQPSSQWPSISTDVAGTSHPPFAFPSTSEFASQPTAHQRLPSSLPSPQFLQRVASSQGIRPPSPPSAAGFPSPSTGPSAGVNLPTNPLSSRPPLFPPILPAPSTPGRPLSIGRMPSRLPTSASLSAGRPSLGLIQQQGQIPGSFIPPPIHPINIQQIFAQRPGLAQYLASVAQMREQQLRAGASSSSMPPAVPAQPSAINVGHLFAEGPDMINFLMNMIRARQAGSAQQQPISQYEVGECSGGTQNVQAGRNQWPPPAVDLQLPTEGNFFYYMMRDMLRHFYDMPADLLTNAREAYTVQFTDDEEGQDQRAAYYRRYYMGNFLRNEHSYGQFYIGTVQNEGDGVSMRYRRGGIDHYHKLESNALASYFAILSANPVFDVDHYGQLPPSAFMHLDPNTQRFDVLAAMGHLFRYWPEQFREKVRDLAKMMQAKCANVAQKENKLVLCVLLQAFAFGVEFQNQTEQFIPFQLEVHDTLKTLTNRNLESLQAQGAQFHQRNCYLLSVQMKLWAKWMELSAMEIMGKNAGAFGMPLNVMNTMTTTPQNQMRKNFRKLCYYYSNIAKEFIMLTI